MSLNPPIDRDEAWVRKERSGWRDQGLSERHRKWGYDVPAIDIDFLMVEYGNHTPCAIIEYKKEFARPVDLTQSGYMVLKRLANAAELPLFVVVYKANLSSFRVMPANMFAMCVMQAEAAMEEGQYVRFLHELRTKTL